MQGNMYSVRSGVRLDYLSTLLKSLLTLTMAKWNSLAMNDIIVLSAKQLKNRYFERGLT